MNKIFTIFLLAFGILSGCKAELSKELGEQEPVTSTELKSKSSYGQALDKAKNVARIRNHYDSENARQAKELENE